MTDTNTLLAYFRGRVPDGWFSAPVEVGGDRDEIMVTGTLAAPALDGLDADTAAGACRERIGAFREASRDERIAIAGEAERRFETKVSWVVSCGEVTEPFTVANVPVMTRLRLPERAVLDTLIDAGLARSRSEAMAWCVRLVGQHQHDWIVELRHAMEQVERVRKAGPTK